MKEKSQTSKESMWRTEMTWIKTWKQLCDCRGFLYNENEQTVCLMALCVWNYSSTFVTATLKVRRRSVSVRGRLRVFLSPGWTDQDVCVLLQTVGVSKTTRSNNPKYFTGDCSRGWSQQDCGGNICKEEELGGPALKWSRVFNEVKHWPAVNTVHPGPPRGRQVCVCVWGGLINEWDHQFYNKFHKLSWICLADIDPEENVQNAD